MLSRRGFLCGLVAAPLIVPADRLMRLRGAVMGDASATLQEWHDLALAGYHERQDLLWARTTSIIGGAIFVDARCEPSIAYYPSPDHSV